MSLNLPTETFTIEALGTNRSLVTAVSLPSNGTAALLRDYSPSNINYYLEIYDGQGNAIIQDIDLRALASNEATNELITNPKRTPGELTEFKILGLSNGNILVSYNSTDSVANVKNAYFFILDASGNKVVSDTQLNVMTGSTQTRYIQAVELSDGNVAFSYQGSSNGDILSKVINPANGNTIKNEFKAFAQVSTSTQSIVYSENQIAAGKNGGYIITAPYYDNVVSGGYVIGGTPKFDYKTFSSTGTLINSATNINTLPYNYGNNVNHKIIPLSDGSYFVAYGLSSSTSYTGKIISSAGVLQSSSVSIPAVSNGNIAPTFTTGSEGFVILQTSQNPTPVGMNDTSGNVEVTLKYYDNSGTLVQTYTNVASGPFIRKGYYTPYSSMPSYYRFSISYNSSYYMYGGYTDGITLVETEYTKAAISNGLDGRYTIGALLFDQGSSGPSISSLDGDTTSYTLGDDTPIKIDTGTAATVSDGDYTSGSIYFANSVITDMDQGLGSFSVDGTIVKSEGGLNDDGDDKSIASGEEIIVNGTVIGTVDNPNNGQEFADLKVFFNSSATASNISTLLQNIYYAELATATEPGDRSYEITITDSSSTTSTPITFTLTGETPTLTSATYDITTGKVTITGNYIPADPNRNDINTTAFTFTGNGAQTHTLTDTATVERTSATSFEITLSATDKAAIDALFNCNGTTALDNTTYNIAAADNWATGVADTQQSDPDSTTNIDISIATVPVTVSNIPTPTITSATYNANTGALVVTATNLMAYPGAINDIDVTKFTFTGLNAGTFTLTANTSNVEITSATSFTITLGSTDKTSVNALLFQNGTEYATGSAYNLAAADNWTLGARASDNIADSTNAITVSGYNNAPTISGLPLSPQLISSAGQATALNDITVADNDGDSLTVTLTASNGTINNLIDANANVAGIQLIGSASYINNALADATFTATKAGTASIGISVTDGIVNNPVTSTYNINVNAAPSIVGLPANPQVVNIAQAADLDDFSVADADGGNIFTVTLTASNGTLGGVTDADANTAGIQLIGSAATINSALAAATFTATKAGTASIGISVSDGIISSPVTDTYNLSVNTAPTIAGIPASAHFITQVGQSVDVDDVTVADVDGDNLTVTLIATNGTLGGRHRR